MGFQLRHLFKNAKLTEVVRQSDKLFINLFNEVEVSDDDYLEELLKTRIILESDKKYPEDALQIYAENEAARKRDEAVLIDLPSHLYTKEVDEKITDHFKHQLVTTQACQNTENKQILNFFQVVIRQVFQKFLDQQTRLKAMRSFCFDRQNSWRNQ